MRAMYFCLVAWVALVLSGCASLKPEPMVVDNSFSRIDNREECSCGYRTIDDKLYKYYSSGGFFSSTEKVEIFNADATKTLRVVTKDDPEFDEVWLGGDHRVGVLRENNGSLSLHFAGGEKYELDLNIGQFPDLFETGFVFGSLKFISAIQNRRYIFAALQKPGNIIVLRFDKSSRQADKIILSKKYSAPNAIGQILGALSSVTRHGSTEYRHYVSFAKDYGTGNFFIGYVTEKIHTKATGVKVYGFITHTTSTFEPVHGSFTLHDEDGVLLGDMSHEEPKGYYHRLTSVYGDDILIDLRDRHAYNMNTLIPVDVDNIEYMVAVTSQGAVYLDPASQDYYFRGF